MTEGGRFPEWLSEPAALRANAPLLLEPYGDWWAIEAGVVALFSVELRDGEVWGARDHLFNAAPGDVLFGLGANLGHVNRGVLAVSLGEAALRKGDERDLRRWRAESPCACDAALLAWTRHWTATFDIPPPGR